MYICIQKGKQLTKDTKMQNFLMYCYYEGMTIAKALDTYATAYDKVIPAKSVEIAKKQIKSTTGKDWE